MIKLTEIVVLLVGVFTSGIVLAGEPVVPEMDAGMTSIALGLTVALVLLIKTRLKK